MKDVLIIQEAMAGGGAEKVLSVILRNFDRSRFRVTLLLLFGGGAFFDSIPADVEVHVLYPERMSLRSRLELHWERPRYAILEHRARRALRGRHFDTAVAFLEGMATVALGSLGDMACRRLAWVHTDMGSRHWTAKWVSWQRECEAYGSLDEIAFVSERCRRSFCELYDLPVSTRVLGNPIDTGAIVAAAGHDNPSSSLFTIVSVGRLVQLKRHDRLIDAAAALRARGLDFEVSILGAGPEEVALQSRIDRLGLGDTVHLLGFCSNPYPYIKAADVMCLTSDTEGYPTVVSESLVLGTPVVTTPVSGVDEQLAEGGGIITGFDVDSIADALGELISDTAVLERLRQGTALAARKFDLPAMMQAFQDVL